MVSLVVVWRLRPQGRQYKACCEAWCVTSMATRYTRQKTRFDAGIKTLEHHRRRFINTRGDFRVVE